MKLLKNMVKLSLQLMKLMIQELHYLIVSIKKCSTPKNNDFGNT